MDILIPLGYKGSIWNNNEIKYCLRSLETNFIDLDRIFIIGFLPDFINPKTVIYLPYEDKYKANKDANIIAKTLKAIDSGISDIFCRISDDQLLLKPLRGEDITPLYNFDLEEYDFTKCNRWRNRLKNTYNILKSEGRTTFNFDSHIPVCYMGRSFKYVISKYIWNQEREGYTINTLYFNHTFCKNIKMTNEKVNIESPKEKIELGEAKYLGYNDRGLNSQLKQVIMDLFPNKSKYEF